MATKTPEAQKNIEIASEFIASGILNLPKWKKTAELIAKMIIRAAHTIYCLLLYGFLCYNFWYWFILPVFPQLPHISYPQATGFCFFMTLFKSRAIDIKDEYIDGAKGIFDSVFWPWIMLLMAFIVHLFL